MKDRNINGSRGREAVRRYLRSCKPLLEQMNQVKERLLWRVHGSLEIPSNWLRQSLNEAEALAWETGMPHLVFPALAEEKIQNLERWTQQQRLLLNRVHLKAA